MELNAFIDAVALMLVLFNPLLMSAYLHDVMGQLSLGDFYRVLVRAFITSGLVFVVFVAVGDNLFKHVLHVRFAAFQVFGGIVFLVIAIRYIVTGVEMVGALRGAPEHMAGAIAMPFMIGPGTISASVLIGTRLPLGAAVAAIAVALLVSCLLLLVIKWLFDYVRQRNERLLARYMEIIGRTSALLIGTIAVEMIFNGADLWLAERS